MRVVIAAAGTAGHINPGIAIANKIKKEEKDSKIIFIGTTRGLENDLVPRAGYELKTINAYGLSKKISIENIKKMCKTIKGYGEAKKIISEFKYCFSWIECRQFGRKQIQRCDECTVKVDKRKN